LTLLASGRKAETEDRQTAESARIRCRGRTILRTLSQADAKEKNGLRRTGRNTMKMFGIITRGKDRMDAIIRCSKCVRTLRAYGLTPPVDLYKLAVDNGWTYKKELLIFICPDCLD